MSRWPLRRLHELLLRLESGSRPTGGVSGIADGVPSIGGEHLNKEGGFEFQGLKLVPEEFFSHMGRGIIQRDDILVVKDGATTGKTSFVGEDFPYQRAAINEHVFLLRVNCKLVLPRFAFYFLFGPWGQAQVLSCFRGAAIGGIAQDFVRSVELPLPPLAEQERIVRTLDEADALRRFRAQADERTGQIEAALFQQLFGDREDSWPKDKFGSIGSLDRGRSQHRPRDEPSLFGGPYPFIQTGDVANSSGRITAFTQTYSERGLAQSRLWLAGTLCITIAANIARTGVLTFDACFPDSVVGFIPGDCVTVEYVQAWLRTIQKALEDDAPQAAQKNINLKTLRELDLAVPPLELQRAFAAHVADICALEAAQAASGQRLNDLFQSLLHRAFEGDL